MCNMVTQATYFALIKSGLVESTSVIKIKLRLLIVLYISTQRQRNLLLPSCFSLLCLKDVNNNLGIIFHWEETQISTGKNHVFPSKYIFFYSIQSGLFCLSRYLEGEWSYQTRNISNLVSVQSYCLDSYPSKDGIMFSCLFIAIVKGVIIHIYFIS